MTDENYLKPPAFMAKVLNPLLTKVAGFQTVAVRGRKSGEWRTVPVNVLERDGAKYLMSARGETQWVRNLRAAGGGELRKRSKATPFTAVELPVEEAEPIIAAYRAKWDSQVKAYFAKLPDPADHPTFRLTTS